MTEKTVKWGGDNAWGKCTIKSNVSNIAKINPFRYRGYYLDDETGLYYLNARYYDPEIGRFISADSIEYLAPETINGLNVYAYCLNNPVMGYDPSGTWDWGIFASILSGIVYFISAIAGGVLIATGVGAPLGSILVGAGVGGLIGGLGNMFSQAMNVGWSNINWGQVAFNGFAGMATGAIMASPLGVVVSGFAIAGIGFVQSVGNDLFDSNGDWSQINWGAATFSGILSGLFSGAGKWGYNILNARVMKWFSPFNRRSFATMKVLGSIADQLAKLPKYIASGFRSLSKSIIDNTFTW